MNEKKLVHVERIAIRWGDMDAMGHVNNTVYFRYMEQARIAWFESLVPRADAWGEISIVIVNASCNFRRPEGRACPRFTNCSWKMKSTPTATRPWCSSGATRSRCASPTRSAR
jgi:hypothetical protein